MTRYLLDSASVIDYLKGTAPSVSLIQSLNRQGNVPCTCDIVIAEVYAGLYPEDQAQAEVLLSSLEFLPTSPEAAAQAGKWKYTFARQGQTLAITDCLIAAVALDHEAQVLTGNIRDYPGEQQRCHDQHRPLTVETSVGLVRVEARALSCCPSCHASSYPLDEPLGLGLAGRLSRDEQEQFGWPPESLRQLERGQAEAVRRTAAYFRQRQTQVDYPRFVRDGYQIGSGLAESASKRLGTDRMKGGGCAGRSTAPNRWQPYGCSCSATAGTK
ncbi:MAG: PIN domain-containing protein [Dehalococcoidia bacterium]